MDWRESSLLFFLIALTATSTLLPCPQVELDGDITDVAVVSFENDGKMCLEVYESLFCCETNVPARHSAPSHFALTSSQTFQIKRLSTKRKSAVKMDAVADIIYKVVIIDGPKWKPADIIALVQVLLMVILPLFGWLYHRSLGRGGMCYPLGFIRLGIANISTIAAGPGGF
jgi:hypothetical protein